MSLSHYQSIFASILADILMDIMSPTDGCDYEEKILECVHKAGNRYGMQANEENASAFGYLSTLLIKNFEGQISDDDLDTAISEAWRMARERVDSEEYRVCDDYGEALELVDSFFANQYLHSLMFKIHGSYSHVGYSFFKLPYNDRIDFLYGAEFGSHLLPLFPSYDMKYLGFIEKDSGKAYALKEPLDKLYWLHDRHTAPEAEEKLFSSMERELQLELTRRVQKQAEKDPQSIDLSRVPDLLTKMQAEYAKAPCDFSDSIHISRYLFNTDDIVRFVDDKAALLRERADAYMKENEAELVRRWALYSAVKKISGVDEGTGSFIAVADPEGETVHE